MIALAAYAPLIALIGALINGIFGRQLKEPLPGIIASLAVLAGFLLSVLAFFGLQGQEHGTVVQLWQYLSAGDFKLNFAFNIDHLAVVMMMIITGVGFLIHIYSIAYMHGDDGFSRYFSFLNLFIAAMLVLVMADSFPLMFIGWEGVGVCSFLLIGFWYTIKANADAARKAFIVNRIGDFGFLLAMFLTYKVFGTLNIANMLEHLQLARVVPAGVTAIALLYLLAAMGKSAQMPLHVWLPDAMAGPTPVSALIHAATMVTAGVYLIARIAPLFAASPSASMVVAWVGLVTAFVAAFIALSQTDIKRILAYSTLSQLGYMFVALGCGAYWVAIFHVFTHAFFKALLFLSSGSVIHALGGEQDVEKMGGLHKYMKVTSITAFIATLAISGVPFLSGFFSKDAILAHAFTTTLAPAALNYIAYIILLITAVMTAFYMMRWYYLVFLGKERLSKEAKAHVHESPSLMTLPLMALAFLSVVAGYLGLPEFLAKNQFAKWLEKSIEVDISFGHPPLWLEWTLILISVAAAAIGLGLAYWVYSNKRSKAMQRISNSALAKYSQSGAGFDGLYNATIINPAGETAEGLSVLDSEALDTGLSSIAVGVSLFAGLMRRIQTGYIRFYALAMAVGFAVLVILAAFVGRTS